jgi:hypothetical protein
MPWAFSGRGYLWGDDPGAGRKGSSVQTELMMMFRVDPGPTRNRGLHAVCAIHAMGVVDPLPQV